MFFTWFLRFVVRPRREARFTPPKSATALKKVTLMQTFVRGAFCECVPKATILKIGKEFPSQNCIEIWKGNSQCFFHRFLSFVIRPQREADFTPLIFKIFRNSITLMQTFACPEH